MKPKMVQHFCLAWDLWEVFGKRCLGWWDRDVFKNLAALRLDRCCEKVPMVMSKRKIWKDHSYLFAQILGHIRRHRLHLTFYICDAGL